MRKLIAGPNGAYICDECIEICAEIIEEEFDYEDENNGPGEINLLKPEEIRRRPKRFFPLRSIIITSGSKHSEILGWSCKRAIF